MCWSKIANKWAAKCKSKHLGYHSTEDASARAYNKYLEDGIDPVKRRGAITTEFTGVCWDKTHSKWSAKCKGKHLSYYATEVAAAQAYNVEAERVGRPLNVVPPAGAAGTGAGTDASADSGTGPKRVAPKTPASPATSKKTKRASPKTPAARAPSKKMKLQDTSAGAAGASRATAAR